MKAERRHELKTNKLATTLVTIPDAGRKFAGRLILACAVVAVISFFIVSQWTKSVAEKAAWDQDLASARQDVEQLSHPRNVDAPANSPRYMEWNFDPHEIRDLSREARTRLLEITDKSSDSKRLAPAWVLRGDLDWALATVYYLSDGQAAFPGAEAEPAMRPDQDRGALLKEAAEAYHQVIEHYPDESFDVIAAQFGLAAIAEDAAAATHNNDNWLQAQQLYQSIVNNPKAMGAVKQQAQYRLNLIPELMKPVLIAAAPPPPAPATTQSTWVFPSTVPSAATVPTTMRAEPLTTRPVMPAPTTRKAATPSATPPTTRP